ncbi:MAG: ArgE/DapE family deacylase [Chloroflexi bacterium]|nr:ArgE/DapE family deacylase [Chloroflexota bacterium]MCC6892633.1 ArgE/DapE family deacylase [Anaerolineae bacterium]
MTTPITALERQLIDHAADLRDEMTAFCARLLQTPSVNGVHDERALALVIAEQAKALGLEAQVVGANPNRPNVVISTSSEGPTGLLLIGHLDTVPAGDEAAWSHPPFAGEQADGKLYGRGAVDTKGGMTAALYALWLLKQHPEALPNGRVQLICVPDEESGATGTLGIKWLHDNGLLEGKGAIYAYSDDLITLGHRGVLRYKLVCRGQAVHSGSNEWQNGTAGKNAITGMARLLLELEGQPFEYSTTPYFTEFRPIITAGTLIQGGVSVNIVPDTCEAFIDIRITPEFDRLRMEGVIDGCIARVAAERGVTFERELLINASAALTPDDSPIVRVLESVVRDVKGKEPKRVVAGPANEGYLLIERSIPTICGFGPMGENAHAIDEYVVIDSLPQTAAIFALTAARLSAVS